MIKLLLFLIFLLIVGVFGYWISQNSGELIFSILGYQIETNVTIASLIMVVFTITIYMIIKLFDKLLHIPKNIKKYLTDLKTSKIIDTQAKLIIELSTKNNEQVKKLANKLYKLTIKEKNSTLNQTYYVLSTDYSSKTFKQLSNLSSNSSANTIYLIAYTKQLVANKNWEEVITLLENAFKADNKNKLSYLIRSLILSYIKLERWKALLNFVESNSTNFTKLQSKNIYVIARYNLVKSLAIEGQVKQALAELNDLVKLLPNFYYSFILMIELSLKYKIKGDILKIAKNYFPKVQNPQITSSISRLDSLFSSEQAYKFASDLRDTCDQSLESRILFVQFALNFGMFDEAFKELSHCLSIKGKTYRLCILMAEFCQRTHGNMGECLEWMKSSLHSQNDICTNSLYFDINSLIIINNSSINSVMLIE